MLPENSLWRRYAVAFLGGFLAMAAHIYWLYGRGNWVNPQRLSDTICHALIFAHLLALLVILARDLPFKSRVIKFSVGLFAGVFVGSLAWWAHLYLYLYQTTLNLIIIALGGFSLTIGFVIAGQLSHLERWRCFVITMPLTALAIFLPILFTTQAYYADPSSQALLYFQADNPNDVFLIGGSFALMIAVIAHLPLLFEKMPVKS